MPEQIILGSDHAGYKLKEGIKEHLVKKGYKIDDLGVYSEENIDYPSYGFKAAKRVAEKNSKGILFCGSGIGMCMVANRIKGIRAAVARDENDARLSREHNDSNILCLGGRITDLAKAKKIVDVWLKTEFSKEERHRRRVKETDSLK